MNKNPVVQTNNPHQISNNEQLCVRIDNTQNKSRRNLLLNIDNIEMENMLFKLILICSVCLVTFNGADLGGNLNKQKLESTVKDFKTISFLNLNKIGIISIEKDTFVGLSNLRELYLSVNTSLFSGSFVINHLRLYIYSIRYIFQGNQLTELNQRMFNGNIRRLDIDNNQLTALHPDAFSTITNIEFLYIQNNKLKTLDPHLFDGLMNMRRLWLQVTKFGYFSFADLNLLS